MVWDRETGEPVHNAIVWQDTRTDAIVRELAGDEGATGCARPSACRCRPTSPGRRSAGCSTTSTARASAPRAASWPSAHGHLGALEPHRRHDGGVHATDVTNASRTMLMNLETLDWHEPSLDLMGIPRSMLPEIRSSSETYGEAPGTALGGVPVAGILGDQQAALFGQTCFDPRRRQEHLRHRLVPAGQHRRGDRPHRQAADHGRLRSSGRRRRRSTCSRGRSRSPARWSSGCATGSGSSGRGPGGRRRWPQSVDDNGGVYFVPAFSGLFAPYWRDDARGVDRRPDRLRQPRPHRPGGAGGDRLAEPRGGRRRQRRSPTCRSPS